MTESLVLGVGAVATRVVVEREHRFERQEWRDDLEVEALHLK